MDKDDKDMDSNNVVPFRRTQKPLAKETSDSFYKRLVSSDEDLKKYWSHVCPGVGLIGLMDAVCDRCLATKPKSKE